MNLFLLLLQFLFSPCSPSPRNHSINEMPWMYRIKSHGQLTPNITDHSHSNSLCWSTNQWPVVNGEHSPLIDSQLPLLLPPPSSQQLEPIQTMYLIQAE